MGFPPRNPHPSNRRQESRFAAGLTAILDAGRGDLPCRAENLSRGGVLLTGALPLDAGPNVRVTLTSTAGDLTLEVSGRVCRVLPDPEGGQHRLGIEFDELGPTDRQVLEDLVARVVEGMSPAAFADLRPGASAAEVREALERVPLAHRVALATRAQSRDREILIQDTNPLVLDALARNPNLTPLDFRALLRVRGLLPRTLQGLARDGKWSGSEEMRILIASHPNTPFADAERLAQTLGPDGRRKLLRRPGVNPALRLKLGQSEK
jgi:hypothetical protein